jgi:hypothetical protein
MTFKVKFLSQSQSFVFMPTQLKEDKAWTQMTANITKILPNGRLTLEFSEMLFIPSNLTQFFSDIEQGLCLNYTPGEAWPNKQNFTFSVSKVEATQFEIQINFENPEYISVSSSVPD